MAHKSSRISIFIMVLLSMFLGHAYAITAEEISTSMIEKGYEVEVEGDVVYVMDNNTPVAIAVDGGDGDVSYLTYLSDVSSELLGYEFLNEFNNDIKFGRAYIDTDGDVAIQMDRNSSGGVSLENIESDFEVFILLVDKFKSDLSAIIAA